MKRYVMLLVWTLVNKAVAAQGKTQNMLLDLADSVKAVSLSATIQIPLIKRTTKVSAGIRSNGVSLYVTTIRNKCRVHFDFPPNFDSYNTVNGLDTKSTKQGMAWEFVPQSQTAHQLLLASASDSAENYTLYSGYLYLPSTSKWKLIATYKVPGQWTTLKAPSSFYTASPRGSPYWQPGNVWCQRNTGSWKALVPTNDPPPVLLPFSNTDSTRQAALDSARMEKDIAARNTDVKAYRDGVYYTMLKEGNGQPVLVTDTVSVFYKGYLYSNGKVFDETKEKPARFPLNRLIKGWQTGLPLCRAGGKIKLVILSGQAYSIRTRAAKIPPNSILVFEIEVVEAKRK